MVCTEIVQGGGVLNSLSRKVFSLASALFVASCSTLESDASSGIECVKSAFNEEQLVRVHEEQKRLFFVMNPFQREKAVDTINTITECLKHSQWERLWSLSVFSEKRYAGYKDEPEIIQFHKNDMWSKGYIAEYDSQN